MLSFFEGDGWPCRAGRQGRADRRGGGAARRRRSPGGGGEGNRQTSEHARELRTKINGAGRGESSRETLSASPLTLYYDEYRAITDRLTPAAVKSAMY